MKNLSMGTGLLALLMTTCLVQPVAARVSDGAVERTASDQLTIRWTAKGGIDLLQADAPDAAANAARLVSEDDRDGMETITSDPARRTYFLLRDKSDGTVLRVAERLIPLKQGSNFRDIGGYPTADGRHVRWGMIYRSGASAMLTPEDVATVQGLGLRQMVDLRSDEERVLAPTRIDGVPYAAVGYSMQRIFAAMQSPAGVPQNGGTLYRGFPTMFAPQMRILFTTLVRKEGPVQYNCSAGQDRTGFTTALILSVLGVPRDVILKDYHLSTTYRQPQWEMPPIDVAQFPDNPVAKMFASYRGQKAQPMKSADGKAFLSDALEEIDAKWGSVDGYLIKEVGLTPLDIASLKATYLE